MGKSDAPPRRDASRATPLAPGSARLRSLTGAEVTAYVVGAAVWAPSVHNTQPWWFVAEGASIALYADVGRQLNVADPAGL